jgi:hypothetical protein
MGISAEKIFHVMIMRKMGKRQISIVEGTVHSVSMAKSAPAILIVIASIVM